MRTGASGVAGLFSAALVCAFKIATPARADYDTGGRVDDYAAIARSWRAPIAGVCESACTMKLAGAACVEPGASLMFHHAYSVRPDGSHEVSAGGTATMAQFWKAPLRAFIAARWRLGDEEIWLAGSELAAFGYRICR